MLGLEKAQKLRTYGLAPYTPVSVPENELVNVVPGVIEIVGALA